MTPDSGGAWAEMDRLRAQAADQARALKRTASGEWRAFAKIENRWRFRGREGDPRIKVEWPCFHVRGRWRSGGFHLASRLAEPRVLEAICSSRGQKYPITPAQAYAVLVAFDAWLEGGAKRMTRPLVIP